MSYKTTLMMNTQEQVLQTIKKSSKILVTAKKNTSKDTIASILGLFHILKKLKKEVSIILDSKEVPPKLQFLPNQKEAISNQISPIGQFIISLDISRKKINEFSYDITDNYLNIYITPKTENFHGDDVKTQDVSSQYDLIIVLDTADIEQIGRFYEKQTELFFKTPIINIDHDADNERYGKINHIDLTSTSTSEVIHHLFFPKNNNLLDEDIATCLLTGIIAQTQCFKSPQVTPKTLNTVGQLISYGGKREEIIKHLYRTKSLDVLKIWGQILTHLHYDPNHAFVWSTLPRGDHSIQKELSFEILYEVIEELITHSPGVQIIALFFEDKDRKNKAIVYTEGNLNALKLTQSLNPKGSKKYVLIEFKDPSQEQATKQLRSVIQNQIKHLPSFPPKSKDSVGQLTPPPHSLQETTESDFKKE